MALFISSVFVIYLLSALIPTGAAQADADDLIIVKTDYELLGFGELTGGGHLTFELRGKAAGDLRRAVLAEYDGIVSGNPNGRIDPGELKQGLDESQGTSYIADMEHALINADFFHGRSSSFDPLHETQAESITEDARGFVEVSDIENDDSTPIYIYWYFSASQNSGTFEDARLVTQGLFDAIWAPFEDGYNAVNEQYARQNYSIGDYLYSYKHTDYRVSLGSFFNPSTPIGKMSVIRTPAGEITTYSVSNIRYDGTIASIPNDRASYSSFNFLENPQILFILVFICCYLTSTLPTKAYANYKYAYPRRLRHKALKIRWLHILSKVLILLLLLFYFFPSLFGYIGIKVFMPGLLLWILAPILAVVMYLVAKMMYDKLISEIPPEPVPQPRKRPQRRAVPPQQQTTTPAGINVTVQQGPGQQSQPVAPVSVAAPKKEEPKGPPCAICEKPITDYMELEKCNCGALFHGKCQESKDACPKCGTSFAGEPEPEEEIVEEKSIQCPTCGEMNKVPADAKLLYTKCTACEVMLERIEPGFNYLVIDDERTTGFDMFVSLIKKGSPGLCISTTFPDKLKKQHDMESAEVVWLTDTSSPDQKTMNPHRLEFEMMRMYAAFVKNNADAAVCLDGFEYMVVENGFEKVFKFIKKVNDLSSVNSATLIIPIGDSSLEPDQLGVLKKEFDKVLEISDDD